VDSGREHLVVLVSGQLPQLVDRLPPFLCVGVWLWGVVVGVVASLCGHSVDALAPEADEGRGSLRYSLGSWQPSVDPGVSEWGNLARVMSGRRHLKR